MADIARTVDAVWRIEGVRIVDAAGVTVARATNGLRSKPFVAENETI